MQDIAVKYSNKMISSLKIINIEIILAIDLKKGKVVRAFAGFRLNYKPLKIITNSRNLKRLALAQFCSYRVETQTESCALTYSILL